MSEAVQQPVPELLLRARVTQLAHDVQNMINRQASSENQVFEAINTLHTQLKNLSDALLSHHNPPTRPPSKNPTSSGSTHLKVATPSEYDGDRSNG